jgi:hypothetical protein
MVAKYEKTGERVRTTRIEVENCETEKKKWKKK